MRPRSSKITVAIVAIVLSTVGSAACSGFISEPGGDKCTTCSSTRPVGCTSNDCSGAALYTTRFARLSHTQWENSVQDLLHLDEPSGLSASFIGDPPRGLFDNDAEVLQVTPQLWGDYQTAAEALAENVTTDSAALERIVPSDLPGDPGERARAFISSFGRRAYRRPLTDAEVSAYEALFNEASEHFASMDAFAGGVRLVLEAMLQSPHFVYRVESSDDREGGVIPLSGYEIAARLSYTLWNTMPDDELLAAAESGELSDQEGVLAQATRMIDDDRAKEMILNFHRQLLELEQYDDMRKDTGRFPMFSNDLPGMMREEMELFVDDVVLKQNGNLATLLTAPFTYVNDELAPLYGLSGSFNSDFRRVDLDPTERSGLLTRLGFLAVNGTATQPHSIFRGVFVNRRILCSQLPPPPDNVPPLPNSSGGTNRERIETHTGVGTCGQGCHSTIINPVGFAFENYDAIGQFRTEDNGESVDASDAFLFDGVQRGYDNAIEFSQYAAESSQAHACYVQNWLEYEYGRASQESDRGLIDHLGEQLRNGTLSIKELVLQLTQTTPFLNRAPAEND